MSEKEREGIECPECGCRDTKTTRTRHRKYTHHGKPKSRTVRWKECKHCGNVILPTKPYTPRHKGKVETVLVTLIFRLRSRPRMALSSC